MRIISKFQDYYDIGLSYGVDKSLVYVRKEIELERDQFKIPEIEKILDFEHNTRFWGHHVWHHLMNAQGHQTVDMFFVGFCGKIYSGLYVDWRNKIERFYNKEDLDIFLKKYPKIKSEMNNLHPRYRRRWKHLSQYEKMIRFFEEYPAVQTDEPFFNFKSPIFYFPTGNERNNQGRKFTLNANLKDVSFYKVIDPYTAFQDISMYIGGVLGIGDPDTVDISESDLLEQKGFDKKWSFRKLPEKKKAS